MPLFCLVVFVVAVAVSGISPYSRTTWFFENVCGAVIIALAVATYRKFRFSDRAYLQGLAFLLLHTVATYYTYPRVPIGLWLQDVFDMSRNHYDRIIHFAFGALILLPIREVFFRREPRKSLLMEMFLSIAVMWWFATGYEILEWWGAVLTNARDAKQFLGIQGDRWDAQKDLLVALIGATLACAVDWVLVRVRHHAPSARAGHAHA